MSKYRMFSEKFIPETEEVFFEEEDIYFSKIEEDQQKLNDLNISYKERFSVMLRYGHKKILEK